MNIFKRFTKTLSILITAVMLAIAVWILAVTTTDPVEKRNYSRAVRTGSDRIGSCFDYYQRNTRTSILNLERAGIHLVIRIGKFQRDPGNR